MELSNKQYKVEAFSPFWEEVKKMAEDVDTSQGIMMKCLKGMSAYEVEKLREKINAPDVRVKGAYLNTILKGLNRPLVPRKKLSTQ